MVARDVGHFQGAKFGDFTLKLESGESLGHLPELHVGETRGEEDIVGVGREARPVDSLGVGLGPEDDALRLPVPDSDSEVGGTTQGDHLLTSVGELNVSVPRLSTLRQHSVKLQRWVLVDVDVWRDTFLGNSEELAAWVHGNRADSIAVLSVERFKFLRLHVVRLVLVSSDEDDFVRRQEVNVVTLHRRDTVDAVEREVTLRDLSIRQLLRPETVRVVLVVFLSFDDGSFVLDFTGRGGRLFSWLFLGGFLRSSFLGGLLGAIFINRGGLCLRLFFWLGSFSFSGLFLATFVSFSILLGGGFLGCCGFLLGGRLLSRGFLSWCLLIDRLLFLFTHLMGARCLRKKQGFAKIQIILFKPGRLLN